MIWCQVLQLQNDIQLKYCSKSEQGFLPPMKQYLDFFFQQLQPGDGDQP